MKKKRFPNENINFPPLPETGGGTPTGNIQRKEGVYVAPETYRADKVTYIQLASTSELGFEPQKMYLYALDSATVSSWGALYASYDTEVPSESTVGSVAIGAYRINSGASVYAGNKIGIRDGYFVINANSTFIIEKDHKYKWVAIG